MLYRTIIDSYVNKLPQCNILIARLKELDKKTVNESITQEEVREYNFIYSIL